MKTSYRKIFNIRSINMQRKKSVEASEAEALIRINPHRHRIHFGAW